MYSPRMWLKAFAWGSLLAGLVLYGTLKADVEGEQVVSGQVSIERDGSLTVIHASDKSIINYSQFSIPQNQTVRFIQPGVTAKVLNRVLSADPSRIDGALLANGIVYIVNPAGVYFGNGALVDVGGLYAAAGSISDADFLGDINRFTGLDGRVVNEGLIQAGLVHLIGAEVFNYGAVVAPEGVVAFTSGDDVLIGERDGHVMVKFDRAKGLDEVEPGVKLSAGDLYGMAIHQSGLIEGKEIHLEAHDGLVEAGGLLDASGEAGGRVDVTGRYVAITGHIDASGRTQGGTVNVGGGFQGNGDLRNAAQTLVMPDAMISVDGGKAGTVVVWSDETTRFFGTINAAGDRGFAEVSGKQTLAFQGNVDLSSENGEGGTLLLDPLNIEISTNPAANTTGFNPPADLVEAFTDDAGLNSVFDVTPGTGSFAGVGNSATVELQATNDIDVLNDFDIAASTGSSDVSLVLRGGNDINVQGVVTASGAGTLYLSADDNTPDGAGEVNVTATGGLATSGQSITLKGNDVTVDPAATINGGTVTLLASDGGSMGLGGTAGDFTLDATELQRITAQNLVMGDTTNNSIVVDNITAASSNGISGTVTLNATKAGQGVSFTTNASTFNALDVNAGTGGVQAGQALTTDTGALAIDGGTGVVNLDADLTSATGLTIQNTSEVDLAQNVDLAAQNGALTVSATEIDLSGAAGTNVITADGGNIQMAPISDTGTPAQLTITGQGDVTLSGINVANQVTVTADDDNNSASLLTSNGTFQTASGSVTLSGSAAGNDTIDLNADVTAGTSLTLQNAQEVDLAQNVDLSAQNGDLSVATNVTNIDLSGAAGTNNVNADGGNIQLAPINDSGTPTLLSISSQGDVTLSAVDIANQLSVTADDNNDSASTLALNGTVQTASGAITLSGGSTANDLIDVNADVTAGTALVMQNAGEVDLAQSVDLVASSGALTATTNVTGIDLSGAAGTNAITASGNIGLAPVTDSGTPAQLNVTSDLDVTLNGVDIANQLAVTADADNDTLSTTLISNGAVRTGSGSITLSGGATADDTIDVNADLTAGSSLALQNAGEVDLAQNVDLMASNGALTTTNVSGIDLSGAAGTNVITADGGNIQVAPISDTGTPAQLTITGQGDVTLSGINTANHVSVTADDDNNAASMLTSNGTMQTASGSITLSGSAAGNDTIDLNADVTAGTSLTLQNAQEADLAQNVDLASSNGNLTATVTGIDLSGAGGTNQITADGGNIQLAPVSDTGTPAVLSISGQHDVTLSTVNIENQVSVTVDDDNNSSATLQANGTIQTASGSITLSGGTTSNDVIDLNADVTAGTSLTLQNAGEVDLAQSVDLIASSGALTASTNVATIDLSGAAGTNLITADNGNISLGPIVDSGTPALLSISGQQDVTLFGVDIANPVNVTADDNASGSGDLVVAASTTVATADSPINLTGNDITINNGALVDAGTGTVTLKVSDGGTIGIGATAGNLTVDGNELERITAGELVVGDATNSSITVDGVTAANSDNIGTVTLNATQAGQGVTFANTASVFNALAVNAGSGGITVDQPLSTDTTGLTFDGGTANVDLNADLTAATSLTIQNAAEVDMAQSVDLYAQNGDLSVVTNVTGIDLSGALGTNLLTADGGNINLAPISDTGTPQVVNITGQGDVTLGGADLANELNVTVDDDDNSLSTLLSIGTLQTASGAITLSGSATANDRIDVNADVTAGSTLTLQNAGEVDLAQNVDLAAQNGNLFATTIDLSGAAGTNVITADSGNIQLGPISDTGTPAQLNITGQGDVTLSTVDIENQLTVTVDDDNNSTSTLQANGTIQTASDSILLSGGTTANDLIDLNADITAGTALTLQNASEVDLAQNVDLEASGGNLTISVTGIDLSGAAGTNVITADSGNIQLAPISDTGTPALLNITGEQDVTLNGIDMANQLTVTVDDDNDSTSTLQADGTIQTALGSITLSGGTTANDVVDLNADVTAGSSLTIQNALETDLAQDVDLATQNGNLFVTTTGIDLSGAGGTNLVSADGGNISLTPVSDTGTPALLSLSGQQNVTLFGVDIENQLSVGVDDDDNSLSTLRAAGTMRTASGSILMTGGGTINDVVDLDADVTAGTSLNITNAAEVDLAQGVDLAASNGDVNVSTDVTGIDLSGAAGTNVITADGGNIVLAPISDTGTPAQLSITGQGDVTLSTVDIENQLSVMVDDDNNSVSTLQADGTLQTASGAITLSGGATANDLIDVDADVTAGSSLTVQNAGEADLAQDVDLAARNGNLMVTATAIDLSGAAGTNVITADGGDILLAPVSDTGTPAQLTVTGQGHVTLGGVNIQNNVVVTTDDDNNSTSTLATTGAVRTSAGSVTLSGSASGDDLIDLGDDVVSGTSLSIQNADEVDLAQNVDLATVNGDLSVVTNVTGIDLSGAAGTNLITADSGNITLAPISDSGTPSLLSISSEQDVTLDSVDLENALMVTVDDDNDSTSTLLVNSPVQTATGAIQFSGGVTANDTLDLDADVTAGSMLVLQRAGEVNVAQGVDLRALTGDLTATTSVTGIDLSGVAGTNVFNAGGDIALAPISDSGSPAQVDITADGHVTLNGVDIENTLNATADDNASGGGTLTLAASTSVATNNSPINFTSDDIVIDTGASVDAGVSTVTLLVSDGGSVGLGATAGNYTLSGSELERISAQNLVLGDATNASIAVDGITAANSNNVNGTVTLNATQAGQGDSFVNNPSTFNTLAVNAGTGGIVVDQALNTDTGAMTLDGGSGAIDLNADVTSATALTLRNASEVDLAQDVDLTASSGDLSAVTNVTSIDLSGAAGTNVITADGGNISLSPISDTGTPALLNITGQRSVTLFGVDIQNQLTVTADDDNNGTNSLRAAASVRTAAGSITLSGGATADDLIDVDADVTAGTTLTFQNASEVDLGPNVDLATLNGDLTANVTGIDLSGAAGTNVISADGGDIQLAPVSDTGNPVLLTVTGQDNVTLNGVDITNALSVTADDDDNSTSTLVSNSTIQTAAGSITLSGGIAANDDIDLNADVTAGTSLTVVNVGEVDLAQGVDLSASSGDLLAMTNVMAIDLSGAAGTNVITADGGDIEVAPISDTGTPALLDITGQDNVTLNGVDIENQVTVAADDNNDSISTLNVAGVVQTSTGPITMTGGTAVNDTIDVDDDITAGTTLTIQNAVEVDLAQNVDLFSQAGDLSVVTGVTAIDLSGVTGANLLTADGGDIVLAPISDSGTPDQLDITGQQDVTLNGVDIQNQLAVMADDDNDSVSTLFVNSSITTAAGDLTLSGGATANDVIDVNADVTAGNTLVLRDAGEVDLAQDADLSALAGDLDLNINVTAIDLSGAAGTNTFTADGGEIELAPIRDTGTPAQLVISSQGNVTLFGVDIENQLSVTADDDDNSSSTLLSSAALQTASGSITLSGGATANDLIDVDADVSAGGALTLQNAAEVDLAQDVDLNSANGDLTASTNVTSIDLSGAGGTNRITSLRGDITLAPITDSGTPAQLYISSEQDVTLSGVDMENVLTVLADDNSDGTGTIVISASSAVTTADNPITLVSDDLTIDTGATVDSGMATVTVLSSDGDSMGVGDSSRGHTLSGAELQRITAGNLVIGDAGNDSITVDNIAAADSDNIAGTVTLNATKAGQGVVFANNASTFNTLVVNAGTGGITVDRAVSTDAGSITFNGGLGTVDLNADLTSATSLAIQSAAEVDLAQDVDLAATNGDLSVVTNISSIDLSGAGGTNVITADGGNIQLAPISDTGTPAQLTISGQGDVTLNGVDMENQLAVTVDDDDSGAATLTTNALVRTASGDITLSGSASADDLIDLDADLSAGGSLTLQNAAEADLAQGVDLYTFNGDLTVNVTGIDLSGAGGTNVITADNGNIELTPISDTGTPALLNISGQGNVTLSDAEIANQLSVTVDDNDDSLSTLLANGALSAGTITLSGGATANDIIDLNADVTASASLAVQNAGEVDLAQNVDLVSQNGDLLASSNITGIDLSGAAGTNVITADGGNIQLAPISDTGTPVLLNITGQGNVALGGVNIVNQLTATADDDNNSVSTLSVNGAVFGGGVTLSGSAAADDTIDLNADVTSASTLTLQNADEVDLALAVDLIANTTLDVNNSVTGIDLSGSSGTNRIVSTSGTVDLAALSDSGTPDALQLSSGTDMTLEPVSIQSALDLDVDTGMVSGSLDAETLTAGTILVEGTGTDDTLDFNGLVTTLSGGVTIRNAGQVNMNSDLVSAGLIDVTGTQIALHNATSSGNQGYTGDVTFNSTYNTGGNDFTVNGDVTLADDTVVITSNGSVNFTGAIDATVAESLEIQAAAGAIDFGGNIGSSQPLGTLSAWTTSQIDFSSAAAVQSVTAQDVNLGSNLTDVPTLATIHRSQLGDLDFNVNTLTMGQRQKMTVYGAVDFDGGGAPAHTITLGDVNALTDLTVNADAILIRLREPGAVMDSTGRTWSDLGVDLVAGDEMSFSTTPLTTGSGLTPRLSDADGSIPGAGSLHVQENHAPITVATLTGPGGVILDLTTVGPSAANPAVAATGADPEPWLTELEDEYLPEEEAADDGLEFVRLLKTLAGNAWYHADPPKKQIVPSEESLRQALERYRAYFFEPVVEAPRGQLDMHPETRTPRLTPRHHTIRRLLAEARDSYRARLGDSPFNASDFYALHALEGSDVSACLETLVKLYRLIDELDLNPRKNARAKQALIGPIASKAFPQAELNAVIRADNG